MLQNRIFVLLLSAVALMQMQCNDDQVQCNEGGNTWTLSTADTVAVIEVLNDQPVILKLSSRADKHNWASKPMAVGLMAKVWSGRQELATDWKFERGVLDKSSGKLVLSFSCAKSKLLLRSIWRARGGRGPIEHWMEIENRGAAAITVSHQDSLSLPALECGRKAEVRWIRRGGNNAMGQGGVFTKPVRQGLDVVITSVPEDGGSPVPWMAVQVGRERGLYVGWEFSGVGRIHAKTQGEPQSLSLSVGNCPDFRTNVKPGETFLVPPAFVGCYVGDVEEGSYQLHRFIMEKLRPRVPADFADPPLIYNCITDTKGGWGASTTEQPVLECVKLSGELGFETFVFDAMWYRQVGDWRWDPKRFPNGIKPFQKILRENGQSVGAWCAWTNAGISDDPGSLSVNNPACKIGWLRGDPQDGARPGYISGVQRICLGSDSALKWAADKTVELVARDKLNFLKHDIFMIAVKCDRSTHRHSFGSDVSYWNAMGYYRIQDGLLRKFPSIILENCSSGGCIKDFGVIRRSHYTVTTDTLANLPNRASLYDSTYAFPPATLLAYTMENWSYGWPPDPGDEPCDFLWRSAMMGVWVIDPRSPGLWTDQQKAAVKRATSLYKQWIRPVIKDCKVYHVLPRPDGVNWDGMFYWNPNASRGVLFVFRPNAKEPQKTVKLRGLNPKRKYRLWCEDGSIDPGLRSGAELMHEGLSIRLPKKYMSDLIFVQDAALGRPREFVELGEFNLEPADSDSDHFSAWSKLAWQPCRNARGYHVLVAESADFKKRVVETTVFTPSISLDNLPSGRNLHWKVRAFGWGGRKWNSGGAGVVRTPAVKDKNAVVFISDMEWVKAVAGSHSVLRDKNYNGKTITIAGRKYPKGVWTHSFKDETPADVVVDISARRFESFTARVGLDDSSGGGSVVFQVLVDGVLKAKSPVMRPKAAHSLRVDVAGARQVTLRVLNGGDGYGCDHAVWGSAMFNKINPPK